MKKEKMCFSGQRDKKESALGMNSIKSVDIVSNHLTWTPEGIDHPILKDITLTLEQGQWNYRAKRSWKIKLSASCTRIFKNREQRKYENW